MHVEEVMYLIESKLLTDSKYVVFRGKRLKDKTAVLIKTPAAQYPSDSDLKRIRGEYAMTKTLDHPNILRVKGLDIYEGKPALILEDKPGRFISDAEQKPIRDLKTFFEIAISVTEAVIYLHDRQLMHKNIGPHSVFLLDNGQAELSGFTIASEFSREPQMPNIRELQEARLEYISPEQTGRLNRSIDLRSDLYSLGAFFYYILTGSPPFSSDDSLDLIHMHLAKKAPLPSGQNPKVPPILDALVDRLLQKNAEGRYQSAHGLLHDLHIARTLFEKNEANASFQLGLKDISYYINFPDRLYGRDVELKQLEKSFAKLLKGEPDLVMVKGYSGIGKTSLIDTFRRKIVDSQGFFSQGKFDQSRNDIPLYPIIQAFRVLMRQLLSLPQAEIEAWKLRLMEALGQNGGIVTEVIPELELIIGKQAGILDLPPLEANQRFTLTFENFIKVFATSDHPLFIFLDDLQWIDSATREWVERQYKTNRLPHLMLIGAYRDNEISEAHPLRLMFERLERSQIPVLEIELHPLPEEVICEFVSDVMQSSPNQVKPLASLIYRKTQGNPFFTRQCLLSLNESNAIFLNTHTLQWEYDMELAEQADIGDNVLELMLTQIGRLPKAVQGFLKYAACLGHTFSIDLLSEVMEKQSEALSEKIAVTLKRGMILPSHELTVTSREAYVFRHDRIQQAALSLSDDTFRQEIKLRAARALSKHGSVSAQDEIIFRVADYYNVAKALITDPDELHGLMQFNLEASKRARNANAFESALDYSRLAMSCCKEAFWEQPSALSREMLLQRALTEHLMGNDQEAKGFFDKALSHCDTKMEKAEVYRQKIHFYNNNRNFVDAYNTGREAVGLLGISLPPKFIPPLLFQGRGRLRCYQHHSKTTDRDSQQKCTHE